MLQQMLHLDRDVVAQSRGHSACSASTIAIAWPGPLKKSGSPNVMCCAPAATWRRMSSSTTSCCTTRNTPLIHRHHGAMPAQMLAAARRFRIADAPRPAVHAELRVGAQRRQAAAVGHQELLPVQRDQRLRRPRQVRARPASPPGPARTRRPGWCATPGPRSIARSAAHTVRSSTDVGARIGGAHALHQRAGRAWWRCASAGRRRSGPRFDAASSGSG